MRFAHDIPLQRSISLDCGIEIFNYLQNLGSECSSSSGSIWMDDKDLALEQYRSFEDIPASQLKIKTRRVSEYNAPFGRNLALNVLKDSYKCLDTESGRVSPQLKKLQKCFTFTDFTEDFKEAKSWDNLEEQDVKTNERGGNEDLSKSMGNRSFSLINSLENLQESSWRDRNYLKVGVPVYRSTSAEPKVPEKETATRHRRFGVIEQSFMVKKELNLRKEVIKRSIKECRSCENLLQNKSRRGSLETKRHSSVLSYNLSVGSDLLKLKRTYSFVGADRVLPTIIISNTDEDSVANVKNEDNTSNVIENRCDCRICMEVEVDKYNIRSVLSKLFVKIISCRDYGRKLTYWDDKSLDEHEMYNCIMHILKLMLGLWLRHLDHN